MEREKWLLWANELNALAQAGLYYGQKHGLNVFDRERYERVASIAAEIVSDYAAIPLEEARGLFSNDTGYITPKLDTRSAVIENGRILLVQEATGKWALPGGWVEQDLSVYENAVKETREEAGLDVEPERLVAVIDRDRHNEILFPRKIIMVFVLCRRLGGVFAENSETVRSGWFPLDALPSPLAKTKTTEEEIRLCFEAYGDPHWKTVFD